MSNNQLVSNITEIDVLQNIPKPPLSNAKTWVDTQVSEREKGMEFDSSMLKTTTSALFFLYSLLTLFFKPLPTATGSFHNNNKTTNNVLWQRSLPSKHYPTHYRQFLGKSVYKTFPPSNKQQPNQSIEKIVPQCSDSNQPTQSYNR